nr:AAA family ATPase [Prevotella sp.]
MPEIIKTTRLDSLLNNVLKCSTNYRHEFIMPEHLLLMLFEEDEFANALDIFADSKKLKQKLEDKLGEMDTIPENVENYAPETSVLMLKLVEDACNHVYFSNAPKLDIPHLIIALMDLEDSWASYLLNDALGENRVDFKSCIISAYDAGDDVIDDDFDLIDDNVEEEEKNEAWRKLVTCQNDDIKNHNPLIGREHELERTIQVLCRKEKNNPLHVGEPGVGKTSLVYGLTQRIIDGNVPKRLKGCKVYQLDMGTMLAGTQYRGDFEKRIKTVMDGIVAEGSAIVYIDEIHNMIGAGQTGDGSMDASNMLKPYLECGDVRFIGSTTYDEYNRYFARSKGIVRRFQQIDVAEPSIDDTIKILRGLREKYEQFHGVIYEDAALEHAVRQSAKYMNDRFLPDKAIDLIDEAGAAAQMHEPETDANGEKKAVKVIGKQQIDDILQKVCKIDAVALKEDNNEQLETLRQRISARIYGQDEAVRQVVEAVQMSKAGLLDEGKPLASLLFVGPTGVGKTEVARVLAQELGISLVRFDMSEYTEKHTVAKLIGSPAGYVGYEDGGLLTDAIRKTPNCVLLLDEIEKAHQDIYNILLQVMDYASLTDNKGRKADFRNVVLIMTSNAGAQYAGQSVGFDSHVSRGEAMMKQVKKIFKPEFI